MTRLTSSLPSLLGISLPSWLGMVWGEGRWLVGFQPVTREMRRPVLVSHARYRWDKMRRQHQLVFPEGILVLNEPGAAIVRLCDGRPIAELISALGAQFPDGGPGEDVYAFLERLARKGLLRDALDS